MEKQLGLWIKDCIQKQKLLCRAVIQEKARSLFNNLRTEYGDEVSFVASHGWFNRFKARSNLHNVVFVEAASVDFHTHSLTSAKEFPHILEQIIHQGNYTPQQIFNVDETGLYWKKMPDCTFFCREEKRMPGFKTYKDRLTLLLRGNASGDLKLKPLLMSVSENPRALKSITKASPCCLEKQL